MSGLEERYAAVVKEFQETCGRLGREAEMPTLIAVSKNFPAEDVRKLFDLGHRHFGENRAQELIEKQPVLPQEIQWHFIGRLQRNKVKYIIDKVAMIHSVDSLALGREIERQAEKVDRRIPVLVQVNLDEEETKAGFEKEDLKEALIALTAYPRLQIKGLMTIGRYHPDPEGARPLFQKMRALATTVKEWAIPGVEMSHLSMGMSHDFVAALEEGATLVRVGSSIFGNRYLPEE